MTGVACSRRGRNTGMSPDRSRAGGVDRGRLASTIDDLVAVLRRLVPLARSVAALAGALGWAVLVSAGALLIGVLVFASTTSLSWLGWVLFLALLVTPGVILLLFRSALREVLDLPRVLAEMPEVAQAHAAELRDLVREAREGPRLRGAGRGLFRSIRLVLRAHDDIPGYGSVLRLASWPFLVIVAASALAAPFLVWAAWTLIALVVVF